MPIGLARSSAATLTGMPGTLRYSAIAASHTPETRREFGMMKNVKPFAAILVTTAVAVFYWSFARGKHGDAGPLRAVTDISAMRDATNRAHRAVSQDPGGAAVEAEHRTTAGPHPIPNREWTAHAEQSLRRAVQFSVPEAEAELAAKSSETAELAISMAKFLREGYIVDPSPESNNSPISLREDAEVGDPKIYVNEYLELKANYLGSKALREVIKSRLKAAKDEDEP